MNLKKYLCVGVFSLACGLWGASVNALPMGFNVDIDFSPPIPVPLGGGTQVEDITGMAFGDPAPEFGASVLDCFVGSACEITSMMFEISGGGGTLANVDLLMVDASNPLGQFTGTATGSFGTVDIYALLDIAYDTQDGPCGPADTLCGGGGMFAFGRDLTGDGATGDDQEYFLMTFSASSPFVSGATAPINFASVLGDPVCGDNVGRRCGTLDVDVKPVPAPATLVLFGLALAGLGVRRLTRYS